MNKVTINGVDLELDLMRRMATRAGQPIELLPKEFTLLEVLMRGEGRVITRTMLLERVWGEWFGDTGTIVGSVSSPLYDWAVDVDGDPMSVRAFAADDLQVLS